jgi:hypothetical protein
MDECRSTGAFGYRARWHQVNPPSTRKPLKHQPQPANATFDKLFRRADDITGDILERKCLPALLFAGVVSPDDRALWLHCMVRGVFIFVFVGVGKWGPFQKRGCGRLIGISND